mmetsp:Transcript_30447/g.87321  ORF Transcript_30447/g.87321 Transcript_30447/m.87321 type:complete len:445 (+) Transcript_30447:316-1650(+)
MRTLCSFVRVWTDSCFAACSAMDRCSFGISAASARVGKAVSSASTRARMGGTSCLFRWIVFSNSAARVSMRSTAVLSVFGPMRSVSALLLLRAISFSNATRHEEVRSRSLSTWRSVLDRFFSTFSMEFDRFSLSAWARAALAWMSMETVVSLSEIALTVAVAALVLTSYAIFSMDFSFSATRGSRAWRSEAFARVCAKASNVSILPESAPRSAARALRPASVDCLNCSKASSAALKSAAAAAEALLTAAAAAARSVSTWPRTAATSSASLWRSVFSLFLGMAVSSARNLVSSTEAWRAIFSKVLFSNSASCSFVATQSLPRAPTHVLVFPSNSSCLFSMVLRMRVSAALSCETRACRALTSLSRFWTSCFTAPWSCAWECARRPMSSWRTLTSAMMRWMKSTPLSLVETPVMFILQRMRERGPRQGTSLGSGRGRSGGGAAERG